MISIIVNTHNREKDIERCLRSLQGQDFPKKYEIIVVDDNSKDNTVNIIKSQFKNIILITKSKTTGWLDSMKQATNKAEGDIIAVMDPDCIAKRDWLSKVDDFTKKSYIVTGFAENGPKFIEKLCAASFHADFNSKRPRRFHYLFDDNFACRKDILKDLLKELPTDIYFDDGAGNTILSWMINKKGYSIIYQPEMKVWHFSHNLVDYFRWWYGPVARNTKAVNRYNKEITGGNDLKRIKDRMISAVMWFKEDATKVLQNRKDMDIALYEMPFLIFFIGLGKLAYLLGLFRSK